MQHLTVRPADVDPGPPLWRSLPPERHQVKPPMLPREMMAEPRLTPRLACPYGPLQLTSVRAPWAAIKRCVLWLSLHASPGGGSRMTGPPEATDVPACRLSELRYNPATYLDEQRETQYTLITEDQETDLPQPGGARFGPPTTLFFPAAAGSSFSHPEGRAQESGSESRDAKLTRLALGHGLALLSPRRIRPRVPPGDHNTDHRRRTRARRQLLGRRRVPALTGE